MSVNVYTEMPEKHCQFCSKQFYRSRYSGSGKLEGMVSFRRRLFCSAECQRRANARSAGYARWHPEVVLIEERSWPWGTNLEGPRLTKRIEERIERQVITVIEQDGLERIRAGESAEAVCDDIMSDMGEKLFEGTVRRIRNRLHD